MRKVNCLLLILLVLLLSACHSGEQSDVAFYYRRDPNQYQYFQDDSVICKEYRDLLNHRADLQYLAGLYLAGPMDEGLISPFTKNTRLISIQKEGSLIRIELSDHALSMPESEFSLSCACLAMTCMDYTPCDEITITSGERTVTMTRDNIILIDSLPQQETTGG